MLKTINWILIIIMVSDLQLLNAKYPTDLPRCLPGDEICLPDVINYYLINGAKGLPQLNLIKFDPLFVPSVDIIQSDDSPVSIKLFCNNVTFLGFSTLHFSGANGFKQNPHESEFQLFGRLPQLQIIGQYKVTGNVLILPIVGNGFMNITMDNLDFSLKFDTNVHEKKNKEYLKLNRVNVNFNTTRVYMLFENLYNGDVLLGNATNIFLNENWSEVINELKPALENAVGVIAHAIVKPLFDKFPYLDIFT